MTQQNKHGGHRPGAGRKHSEHGQMVKATYRLTAEQKAKVARLGGAEWLRRIVDAAREAS